MVHIGDHVTVTCTGPGQDGKRNTLLKWEFVNTSKIPANVKITTKDDIHENSEICDVERLDISGFTKENEGDYRCIKRANPSPHADIRIVMIGKGSSFPLHFYFFACKNSSNYHKARFFFICLYHIVFISVLLINTKQSVEKVCR